MSLPNILTVSRLLAAIIIMLAMALPIPFSSTVAFVVFAVSYTHLLWAAWGEWRERWRARREEIAASRRSAEEEAERQAKKLELSLIHI